MFSKKIAVPIIILVILAASVFFIIAQETETDWSDSAAVNKAFANPATVNWEEVPWNDVPWEQVDQGQVPPEQVMNIPPDRINIDQIEKKGNSKGISVDQWRYGNNLQKCNDLGDVTNNYNAQIALREKYRGVGTDINHFYGDGDSPPITLTSDGRLSMGGLVTPPLDQLGGFKISNTKPPENAFRIYKIPPKSEKESDANYASENGLVDPERAKELDEGFQDANEWGACASNPNAKTGYTCQAINVLVACRNDPGPKPPACSAAEAFLGKKSYDPKAYGGNVKSNSGSITYGEGADQVKIDLGPGEYFEIGTKGPSNNKVTTLTFSPGAEFNQRNVQVFNDFINNDLTIVYKVNNEAQFKALVEGGYIDGTLYINPNQQIIFVNFGTSDYGEKGSAGQLLFYPTSGKLDVFTYTKKCKSYNPDKQCTYTSKNDATFLVKSESDKGVKFYTLDETEGTGMGDVSAGGTPPGPGDSAKAKETEQTPKQCQEACAQCDHLHRINQDSPCFGLSDEDKFIQCVTPLCTDVCNCP